MLECITCEDQFYYQSDYVEHLNEEDHWLRYDNDNCGRRFDNHHALDQHMTAKGHMEFNYPCQTCRIAFRNDDDCVEHMNEQMHWKNFCMDCNRRFSSEQNYRAHRNSRLHRGATITCPFCKVNHTTASGLLHHLETGSCPQARGLNRDKILQVVRERDPNHIITKKLLTYHEGTTGTYSATDQAWNGRKWECYLCHRGFGTDRALNQHLNSPAHQQPVYHCPNGRCGKDFRTLASMFNHLESESCAYMRFENVQQHVGNVLGGNRLIAFG
ncbi:hypothetical protein LTS10_010020 [Elasticomyces elasticus]|nr:hypothetical protein LTS10_010020 [Elasticomyces elasticus]